MEPLDLDVEFAGPVEADVAPAPPSSSRNMAVVVKGHLDGAYLVYRQSMPLFCLGRGRLDGASACVVDDCGNTTLDYITANGAANVADACYHTCFRQSFT